MHHSVRLAGRVAGGANDVVRVDDPAESKRFSREQLIELLKPPT